ncbi:MAG: coproporphyrinogen III oxidase [Candidatus Schekmanbacteria bacterium]|nr:MAG: coproporphyrinogen III oxidase [Candidatus Schekmanbacteria bacterium]
MLDDTYLIDLKKRFIDTIDKYNDDAPFETKKWDFLKNEGCAETNVSRGNFFEKAVVSTVKATVTLPDNQHPSTIQWLGIQTFPSNPLVPALVGVFEHVSEKGGEFCPAFYDVYPVIPYEEDKEYLKTLIEDAAIKHNREYKELAEGYKKMFRVKETGIGIGYGIGVALGPEETDSEYYKSSAEAIFKGYFDIVEKRKNEKPKPEHFDEMFKQRREWVRFTFMENRFFLGGLQVGVPAECFMLHMLPPVVKF